VTSVLPDEARRPEGTAGRETAGEDVNATVPPAADRVRYRRVEIDRGAGWQVVAWVRSRST